MNLIEKTCPVCGNKFEVEEKLADRELYCTLGCCLKAGGDDAKRVAVRC